jgi:hypothetical protein
VASRGKPFPEAAFLRERGRIGHPDRGETEFARLGVNEAA